MLHLFSDGTSINSLYLVFQELFFGAINIADYYCTKFNMLAKYLGTRVVGVVLGVWPLVSTIPR